MAAQSLAARLKTSGLLRSQGLIGGKWVDAYDGKTIEVLLTLQVALAFPIFSLVVIQIDKSDQGHVLEAGLLDYPMEVKTITCGSISFLSYIVAGAQSSNW